MRKPDFVYAKYKTQISCAVTAQLISGFCFRYTDSTIPLLSEFKNFKPLAIYSDCTARFVSDLVGNPEDRFSHNEVHILLVLVSVLVLSSPYVCTDHIGFG